MPDILEIRMQLHEVQCSLCGDWTEHRWGVPTFNGDVVSNDFPDWLWGQAGGGQPVCEKCYDLHAAGKIETFDQYYMHLAGGFTDGGGI